MTVRTHIRTHIRTQARTQARTQLLDQAVGQAMSALSAAAKKGLDDARLAHLIGLIAAINNWNRVMVTRRIPPGGYTP